MNLASRRQRQYQRKYNSFRKYTATEDVNYAAHTSRSAYRSESVTSRSSDHGRSSSSEIISVSETRSLPVYIATQDYIPEPGDTESISLEQGQIVEVLDKKNAASWLIRTKARPPKSGWVPGSYFESPTEYYKQRKSTRELVNRDLNLTEEQEAIMKTDQVYHDLLRSEEEFVNELRTVVDTYVKALDDKNIPEEVKTKREELIMNLKQLHNFHANIMLKGLQYYSDDPNKVGQTFTRLSRDFDLHIQFHHNLPYVQELLKEKTITNFLQDLSNKVEAGTKTFDEHLQNIADRIVQYQNYFKEFVKYASRAKLNIKTMQKALELLMSVPERANDMVYIKNIEQYPGDLNKLGRLYRHDSFLVWEGEHEPTERYIFLFKNKLMFTDKNSSKDTPSYKHYATIRLDKYTIRVTETEPDTLELEPNEPGLPEFQIRAKDVQSMEFIRQAWLKDISEMKGRNERDMEEETISELDVTMSDVRSEFSEYSTISRNLFGPEEGPPRKKIKSPPVISPTASTTSLYSGGSSSIDWTTTGTTLDMQGTRVTRTQYGFRTLQESSAKMCLKVTGYPLPEISWYKDNQILHEDERHTFYADEDGFFALTIDPVQVDDTGRYTCMATNEYGQACTSAFFKVLKVEKEAAPPAFVTTLQDQEVREGEMVSFECEVEGWPEPELVWLVDEQPLRPSHDFKLEYDGQNAKLEIRDAQPEDTGVYTVRIKNEYGTAESNAKLMVEPDPDKNHIAPEFQAVIEDVECNEGDTVKFKAILTGDPNPDVIWMINGVPLSESDKIKFISEDGICIITITDVSRHFDGTITCQGINRLGTQHCEAQLKVRVPPSPPNFERPLEDRITQEEQTVILETEISGFPDPAVSFTIKGKPIISGENDIEIIDRGSGCYRIEILKANSELHDGEIVCTAINDHGQAESRARIIVESVEKEIRSAPTFVKDIEDQIVKYGEKAIFETSVRGSPNPEVTWFINGQKVDKGTCGIQIETQSVTDHKLIIDSAQYSGTILCRAENLAGRYETRAKLIIISDEKKKRAPEFIEKLVDTNVMEGSNAVFEVRVEAEPAATLKWFLDEKELIESERVKIREFDGSWKLEINKLTIEESGIIRCVAENSEGASESSANFTVNKKPYAPQFKDRPKNVTIEQGQEARFEAHAIAVPEPVYQWSIGGRKIKETTEGAKVEIINGVSILTVNTKIFDSSTISVTAINPLGVDETGALLTVEEKQLEQERTEESRIMDESENINMPMIKKGLEDQSVKYGEMADFEVSIEPNEVVVEWYCNEKQLIDGMPGVKISQQNFDFKLTIDSAQYAGIITFKASNKAGKVDSSANLIAVQEKIIQKAPEFLNKLDDISVTERDKVEVIIESTDKATFEWALNEKILQGDVENVTIRNEGSKSMLIFEKVSLQQAGKIKVVATSEGGQAASSFIMTVKEADIAPEIITGPNSLSIKENDAAEFRVEITGKPKPTVKWLLNGRELSSSDTNIIIKSFEEVYTLKIEKANLKHAGELVVTAENTAGMVGKEVVLKVEPDLTKPVFKTHLIDRSVNENEPLRWDVAIERPYKGITVKWFLNGKELTSSENIQIIDHGEGKYHVTINEAKIDMTGTLVVKATNSYGTSESHASVEVKEVECKPEITRQPQDHIVEENQTVKFSAIISGKPTPTVSWYMDEMKLENNNEVAVKFDETTGKTSIKIFKAKLSDSKKKITLKAENTKGQIEASALLTVNKKSEPPNILTEMKSRQVNEGETVNFSVKVAGYPSPEVTWFHNGEPVIPDGNTKITEEDGTYTLILNGVTPEQSGEISCEAKNTMGSKKQLATLTIKPIGNAPFFERNIQDKLVVEGEELIMDAKLAEVKPSPTISWLKDGKPLKDARFKLSREDDGTLRLKIDSAELNDKSRITIRAENRFGSADCSASIGVTKKRPMAKPAFLSDIPPITVTEGESLNVKVIITGDPVPFAKWYINDQLVVATEDTEMKEENGVYSLTIHGCTRDMTGIIKCVSYNKAGEATVQGYLNVLTPIPVEFETSLCDAVCREGDTLKLKAVLMGEPTPEVSWYVNGKKLEESQNIKIHAEKGTYTVTIRDITCDYSGKVVCEAVNEYGKAVSEASLLVLPRGEPPDFIEWLSNVKARQGSQVIHKVVFTGDPKPDLTWYINGEEMKNSDEITIVTDDNTSTLVIKSFSQEKHTGEIICKAENDAGEVSCTASMGAYTSDIFSESQTESEAMADEVLNFEDGVEFGTEADSIEEMQRTPTPIMAPKFITKIKDTRAARGHQAIFECVVPDTKGVCCKWLKDGREIELIARIRVQTRTIEGFVTSELIIDNVVPEDAGKYTVVVENVAGKDSCEATLNVIEVLMKPETSAPEFVVAMQDKTCKEAEKVIFECKVIGEPQPTITWFHEKTAVVEETNKTIIESDGTVQRLVIVSADVIDRGQYICLAENVEGKAESKAILTVLAEAPQFTRPITSKEVSIGEKVILDCSVKGSPQPTVQFFRESTRITSDSHHSIEHDISNVHWRLLIEKAEETDFRKYHAVAINSVGMAESEAEIKQKQMNRKPEVIEVLKNRKVIEGDEIIMEVKFSGIPQPDIKWFKDSKEIIEEKEKIIIKTEEGQSTLIIKNAKLEESGSYHVELFNSEGKEMSSANVTVESISIPPQFTEKLTDVEVHELETIEMKATATGIPTPEVQWFKDGTPVQINSERIFVRETETNQHILTIKQIQMGDAGVYSCKASNKAGVEESKAKFVVLEILEAPKFIQQLSEITIKEAETAELAVTITGKPTPEVSWAKDGAPINIDNINYATKQDESGHHTLVIKRAKLEASGVYSCKASNKVGEMETKTLFAVEQENEMPQILEDLKELSIQKDDTAELSVTVVGKPVPEVVWYKDGVLVNIDNEHIFQKDNAGRSTLIIKEAQLKDTGVYSCKATNIVGTAEIEVKFAVEESVEMPKFIEGLQEISVQENETAQLSVTVVGKPEPEVAWFKDGVPINIDNEHIISKKDEKGHHTLIINEAQLKDIGIYSCKAVNLAGTEESEAKFAVEESVEMPKFIEGLQEISVQENETAQLSVTVVGKPEPEVAWFKDGVPINIDNEHITSKKDEKGHHTLIINEAQLKDIGIYSCKAVNLAGTEESEVKFAVEESVEMPKFIEGLQEISVQENETAQLSVTVVGKPEPEVAWFKDGVPINIDNEHIISKKDEKGHHTLIINEARLKDIGTYSCKAVNLAGTEESEAKFAVEESVEMPKFIEGLQEISVQENETAQLSVTVVGKPEPEVAWFKDGVPINIDNEHIISKKDEKGHHTLIINEARLKDIGTYSCKAVNLAGTEETEAKFAVISELSAPLFTDEIGELEIQEGGKAELTCTVIGKPTPEITWLRNGVEIYIDNTHFFKKDDENGKQTLIIDSMNKQDYGAYVCVATNQLGTTETIGKINFPKYGFERMREEEVKPIFIEPLEVHTAKEGETVSITCRVNEDARADIQWFVGDKPIESNEHMIAEKLENGIIKLTIENATKEDVGVYRCEATNKSGKATTAAELNFASENEETMDDESALIGFIQPLHDIVTTDNSEAELICALNVTKGDIQIKWSKDGSKVPAQRVTIEQLVDGTQKLKIAKVTAKDVGTYRCTASIGDSSAWTEGKLIILETTKEIIEGEVPEFTELLKSCTVAENAEIILQCKLKGLPRPTISWMKDGVKLEQNHRVITEYREDGTIVLKIKDARKDDSGEYRCDAVNEHGAAWTAGPVRIVTESELPKEGEAPDFIQPIKPVTVTVGETAILEGKVTGQPEPEVKWFNGENMVKENSKIKLENFPDGTQRLTFKKATIEDTGEYRCIASNKYGDVWSDATLTVQAPTSVEGPTFLKTLESISAKESEHVIFECKIVGEPMPEIRWFKNKQEIKANDTHFKKEILPDGTTRLIIDSVNKDDAGEFRCEARNAFGTARTDATLDVLYGFEVPVESENAPEFAQELKAIQATEEQKICFECRVVGVPIPEVKWFKDGEEIKSNEHIQIESLPDGTNRLLINSVKIEDQGNYRCEATNNAGSMSSKAPLAVNALETLKLKKGLTDTRVEIGSKIQLFVEVEGKPKTVKWFHGKDEIKGNKRTKLEAITEYEYSLETDKAENSDEGIYRVILSIDTETVESSCTLTVFKTEVAPAFRKGLQDQSVPKGSKLVLEIELDDTPKQVKWLKDALPVDDKIMKTKDLGNGKYQLVIDEIKDGDVGEYTVQVSNDAGTVESKAKILLSAEKPEIVSGLKSKIAEVGKAVSFEVETKGPIKQVKWYKNGAEIKNAQMKKIGDNKYQLIIDKATKNDEAEYKVILSNDEGDVDSTAKLTVKLPKIAFNRSLEDQTVDAGTKVILSVEVNVAPKQVKWYKNGKEITLNDKAKPSKLNDNTYQLMISNVDKDDIAEYKIALSTDSDTVDSSCVLTLNLPELIITKGLKDQAVNAGEKVLLDVEVNTPPKSIKWYKNGREIGLNDRAKPKKVNDTNYQLEIPNATEDDAVDYKVMLSNDKGSVESNCTLVVKKPAEKPTIKKGIEDQFIAIGKSLEIAIETTGEPKIVRWYKNGQILSKETTKTIKMETIDENNYILKIEKSTLDDSGTYSVEVQNEAGQAKSSGEITVEDKLIFLKPLQDVEVVEAEQAVFMVETNVHPRIVKWYKNGQEIKLVSERIETKDNMTKFQLIIKKTEISDAADYKVILSNSAGNLDSSANLTVKKSKGQPKIIEGLENQVIAKGDELILEIKVDGEPTEVRWLKNGATLPKNVDAKIEQIDEKLYRLTIPRVDTTDAGTYSVEVINEVGKVQSSGDVEVDVKPEIVKGLEDNEIELGDEQSFKVETNVPIRDVKWYKNGQEIKPSSELITKQITSKKFELLFTEASLDDAAVYEVTLSNKAGTCNSSASLTVTKSSVLKVLDSLKDVEVNEGEPVKLSVKVEGQPKTVKWLKNGQEIKPDDRLQITENPETGEYILTIPESLVSDDAAYRIILSNARGEVQSGSITRVKPKKVEPVTSGATFVTPLEDVDVPEGDNLTLKCKVSGEPMPTLKWYKDGVEITKDNRVMMRIALDGAATLRILDSKKEDAGWYSVSAINSAGESKSECNVRVLDAEELPSAPEFIIPLKDIMTEVGTKAEFNIKVRGIPKPILQWSVANEDVSRLDGIKIEDMGDGNWTMIIENVVEEFIGPIKCIASNEHGKVGCESQLIQMEGRPGKGKIEEGYPPKFNVPLWDRRISEGQVMTIECHVDAKPTADIIWTKDGITLVESDYIEIRNTPDGACRLRISSFGEADVGTYKCTASNAFGVADTKSNINIQAKEKEKIIAKKEFPPRFNPPLTDKYADIEETVRLSCKVDASPKASITWYKDGVPLRSNGHIIIDNDDDGNCLLTINHSTESDDGAYRCVAINDIGSSNSACMVFIRKIKEEIKKEGEEPFFTKGLVDKWLERGDKLILQCTVIGDPKPEIRWYRNGILLRSTNKINIENTPDGLCTLTIEDCAMSDEGIYRCDAENSIGKTRTQSTIHIERPVEKLERKVVEGTAPRFIIPLQDITVYAGSTIDLECKVTGEPMPAVKWSKDGMVIRDDSRYQWEINAAAGTYLLKIIDANLNDEGAYRCVATNAAGSATTKAFVRIDDGSFIQQMPSSNEPPRFTIVMGDARAIEGQQLKFECKIEGASLTDLVWYKDGERIIPDDRIKIESDSDGRARLIINSCNANDEGLYRVIATNPFGTAHSKGIATVKKLPEDSTDGFMNGEKFDAYRAPRVIVPLESIKIMEGNGFVLRCKFSGDPRPKIKWFKDGERVYSYDQCTLNENKDGTCELTVKSANRFDSGCYRCVAENIYGSDRTTCEVVVQLKEKKPQRNFEDEIREGNAPGFSVTLAMKRVKAGDTVILECIPYGKPFPEIKWLKDGIEIETNDKIKIESLDDKTQRIILKDVDFFAEGFYRCVATNEYGTASTKGEVALEGDRILLPKKMEALDEGPIESKPRIRRGLYNMSVHQGNTIEMQVCTSGWPTPSVKWFKNGQELKSSGPDGPIVLWTDERGIHHCVILNASPEDEAEYALEATNKLGMARTEGAITIIKPREVPGYEDDRDKGGMPYPPGFIRQLKNKHIFSHMPTIFDCLVVGYSPPEVEWFHNGKRILPGDRIRIQSCGGGSHALIIMDTLPEDAGEYVAIAKNSQGQASSSAVLDVTVPLLDSIKFDGSMDVTPYLTEEYGFKKVPHHNIPTPPDRGPFIKEVTGHYLTLSWIPTKRAPPRYPQVTYVIEIRELPEKDWVLLDYNIPEPVCKVRNLQLGKSYQFRVRAENIYGISDPSPASPPSRLMAPPQPVLDKNKRVIPLLDPYAERALDQAYADQYACAPWFAPGVEEKRFCAENEMLSITLHVSGYPDPKIAWKFRNMNLDTGPTSRIRVLTHAGRKTTLIISGFSKENVGQYQCIATNQYGEAQQNIHVDLGARPRFIQPLINKVVPNGKPLRLDVRVEGNPIPELKWMKDWRPIVESSHVTFVREGSSLYSLIINDPFWCDCGIYSVAAVNDAGTTTTSCSVTVEEDENFGMMHEIRKKKPRIALEARKVREIYEIDENDEKAAAAGAPFHVTERTTNKRFLAQLRELDENLARNIEMQNNLDHPNIVQLHQAIMDQGIAVLIYENVNRSLLDSLISSPVIKTGHVANERQVQVFVKQLLCALKCMHDRKIAHLDIRPEAILLQDDHLRLADFGQSRRLVRGKVIANIMGSPEFISPEIAAGIPVTLASDLWSVGTLTYILLCGISPFLGDNDTETVRNVMLGNYALDVEEFNQISNDAKDFVSKLLVLDPRARLNVNEALNHPWLSEEFLENAPITSECLREFKYKHKWLERRVFVQQTPSEQLMSTAQIPNINLIGSSLPQRVHGLARSEPYDIYDYLRIKDRVSPRDDIRDNAPKRHLQPQEKGETPSRKLSQQKSQIPVEFFDAATLPLQLVQGEHRAIEEEIANRILSDISEETSITGSIASHDELELPLKMSEKQMRQKKSRSKSSTPQVEGFSLDGTPIASPTGTGSAGTPLPEFSSNVDLYRHPIQLDPSVPVGAPLFLEGLEHQSLALEDVLDIRSPQSLPSLPGTKSPILLSPTREYTMGVIIGTKQGIKGVSELVVSTPQFFETEKTPEKQKAIERKHEDEFENIMNEIEEMKRKRRKEREEMERLRPKNIYDEEIKFKRSDVDDDEFPWESQYQIGPETFLLATRGADFNARIRDYRRELWGDGAPLVNQGYLGYRNQDITVRERRRFTDLIREDENIAKSVDNLEHGSHFGAIRRIRSDISKAVPVASREDGTFGAIFRNRLKDIAFVENGGTAIFKCAVIGNPLPTVEWFSNESLVVDDYKHKIFYENGLCQLTIHKINLTDLGEYACVASNELGIDRTSARLIAGDTPARPGRPEIELSSDTEVLISWEAPQMNHAMECFMYRLEVRPAGENDHFSEWHLVSDKIEDETAIVRHLTPQGIYQFRVIAKNEFGWGAPSLTSRIIQTHPKGSPKLQIEALQGERRVFVITKPPKTRLISKSKNLGEITEEDEEKCEADEVAPKAQTPTLVLNTSENPEKRFQLIAPIPRGRFAKIAFAIDTSRETDVDCIAKIRNIAVESANNIIEFEAMKECQQENVARLIAAYQCNKSLFLFMERYQEDIFERFTYRDTYNEEQISRVVAQIASALHWIHFRGYVHMDVQASNVLFASRQSWQIKLTDFASAQKLTNEIKQPSRPNLYWASPEMLRTDNKKAPITGQTDIWGLGIITFCLLSGFHPFASEDDSDDEIKESIIYQKCNPNLIQIQATQESLKFVTWALKKDPMKRIRTDEALTHRWLSMDSVMIRRRETVNYPSSRLRKTAILTINRIKDRPPMTRFPRSLI